MYESEEEEEEMMAPPPPSAGASDRRVSVEKKGKVQNSDWSLIF